MQESGSSEKFLYELEAILAERAKAPVESSYTAKLLHKGLDKILQKVGEESVEYIIDAKNRNKERAVSEASDLLYHLLVSFHELGIQLADVDHELKSRHKK